MFLKNAQSRAKQRIRDGGGLGLNEVLMPHSSSKAQGSSQKRGRKDGKSQGMSQYLYLFFFSGHDNVVEYRTSQRLRLPKVGGHRRLGSQKLRVTKTRGHRNSGSQKIGVTEVQGHLSSGPPKLGVTEAWGPDTCTKFVQNQVSPNPCTNGRGS